MTDDPARDILNRLDDQSEICGSEPPRTLIDDQGNECQFGDCWCTLPPLHDGLCFCEICTARYGAPGWPTPETDTP